jgi:exodeoxyribonuclease V alpha subunit
MEEQIEGAIVDIKYYNELNGYSVFKVLPGKNLSRAQANDPVVTVVGHAFKFLIGESARFHGHWVEDWKYGWQFEAQQIIPVDPRTVCGIIKYLSGGMFKGIGNKRAKMIANHFGSDTIRILDYEPERIYEVSGIPQSVGRNLVNQWKTNRSKRSMMTYIQSLGIGANIAQDIFNEYGEESQETIERNPFLLDEEYTYKIGFDKVDQIARNRGVDALDKYRLWTGLEHTLHRFSRDGHTFAPKDELVKKAAQLLRIDGTCLENIIQLQLLTGDLVVDDLLDETSEKPITAIYLPEFYAAEADVASRLQDLCASDSPIICEVSELRIQSQLAHLCEENGIDLAPEQDAAIAMALRQKLSILTGGPGTGKTATLRMLIQVLIKTNHRFALAAPTGRAAKRLSESTEEDASTIHRLLKYAPETDEFQHNEANLLKHDIIIVDEASMLDLMLFRSLLKALPLTAHLLLVGDVDQLPPVGAGNVLRDIINSRIAPVVELKTIFRQEAGSLIAKNAQLIKQGKDPRLNDKSSEDFYFFNISNDQKAADEIVELVTKKIGKNFGFDPLQELQVLAPMYAGLAGIDNLNARLRQSLNKDKRKEFVKIAGYAFRVGDKVMQRRNNYEKGIYNGEIGFITSINNDDKSLELSIDDNTVTYDFSEASDLAHAYCISIHKSQGSEYPAVVLPILMQQGRMLQRNLLYTAISRAKELLVLVGSRQAIWTAISNSQVEIRYSGLQSRLQQLEPDISASVPVDAPAQT